MESTPAFAPPDGVRGAGAGRLLLLLAGQCWTSRWCARSWSWTATASTLMDEVYAFLHAAGWSWSWTPGPGSWTEAATTLLDEVCAFLRRRLRDRLGGGGEWRAAGRELIFSAPLFANFEVGRPYGGGGKARCCSEGRRCLSWLLFVVDGGAAAGTTLHGFCTGAIVSSRRVFSPRQGRTFYTLGKLCGSCPGQTPISSRMRSTTTGMDIGAGPPAGSGGGLAPCSVETHQQAASRLQSG